MRGSNSNTTGKGAHLAKITVALITAITAVVIAYFQFAPKTPNSENKRFTGRVSDAHTKKPVQDAKVTIEAGGVSSIIYVDSEGIFSYPLEESISNLYIKVKVEAKGYQDYDLRINPAAKGPGEVEEIRIKPTTSTGVSTTIILKEPRGEAGDADEKKGGNR